MVTVPDCGPMECETLLAVWYL